MKLFALSLLCAKVCVGLPFVSIKRQEGLSGYTQSSSSIRLKRISHPGISLDKRQDTVDFHANDTKPWPALPIKVGSQELYVLADLGSRNFWIAEDDFRCFEDDVFLHEQDQGKCVVNGSYTRDNDLKVTLGKFFSLRYAAGRADGSYGEAPVTIGDITLKAPVGLLKRTNIRYLGPELSGVLGLSFQQRETSHNENGRMNTWSANFITMLYKAHPEWPQAFSMALSRDESRTSDGGLITFGGYPDLTDPTINATSGHAVTVPLAKEGNHGAWDPNVSGFVVGDEVFKDIPRRTIIDSGDAHVNVPKKVADAARSLWDPPLREDGSLDCNAQLTKPFGVKFGDTVFYISSSDLVVPFKGQCYSGIKAMNDVPLLGMPFMKNVLALFDYTKAHVVLSRVQIMGAHYKAKSFVVGVSLAVYSVVGGGKGC